MLKKNHMKNKQLIGIRVFGIYLILYGVYGFLRTVLEYTAYFYNKKIFYQICFLNLKKHNILEGLGKETAAMMSDGFYSNLIEHHPLLTVIVFIIIPLIFFLFILSGIGILRLKESWRINTIFIYIAAQIVFLMHSIYGLLFYISISCIGIFNTETDNAAGIDKIQSYFRLLQYILTRQTIFIFLMIIIVVYFLTHPKVKALFK